jgi:hypothetical protein
MRTKDILKIYWDNEFGEVNGQTFYLFSNKINYESPEFPLSFWPKNTNTKKHKLFGDDWVVWLWDVKFSKSPCGWKNVTRSTLSFFIDSGAEVSWCGLDGCFCDPPMLFDPNQMSTGIYAALTKEKNFFCHTEFNGNYEDIKMDELLILRCKVKGVGR